MLSDETFYQEIQPEWREAVKRIARGEPDRTDLMMPLSRTIQHKSQISANEVIDAVCQETGFSRIALLGRNRRHDWCRARHLMIYVANEIWPERSDSQLARRFNRDHTTVLNSLRRAAHFLETDQNFRDTYRRVRFSLGLDREAPA